MSVRVLAAALLLELAATGPAVAEDAKPPRVRLALDRLRAGGVTPAFSEAVEERVCAALGEVAGLDVVCPADLEAAALLARNAAVLGECASDDCLKRLEAMGAADQRVSGAVERGEEGIVLSLQLTRADGPGPRVVEKLPGDLDAIAKRLPAIVKRLFAVSR